MITAGIDAGSRTAKAALLDTVSGRVLATAWRDQGVDQAAIAAALLEEVAAAAGLARRAIDAVVATGYGRTLVPGAQRTITEITCHAAGVHHQQPEARSLIEIGGQDSKAIRLGEGGRVEDFAMNDRCAAGTGRFLEMLAVRLGTGLDGFAALSAQATAPRTISSMCVVFAESEIVGLLAGGAAPADILAGVQAALADRVAALAGRLLADPVAFTGGVALVGGMRQALERRLGRLVLEVAAPLFTGAIGAAVLAGRG